MNKSKTIYKRSQRHRAKSKLRNKKSVRRHTKHKGRTGSIHSKLTPSSVMFQITVLIPNSPTWHWATKKP